MRFWTITMRFTVGKKLNLIIITLLVLGIGGAVFTSTHLYTQDLIGLLKKGTIDTSALLAQRFRSEMKLIARSAQLLGSASLEEFRYREDQLKFISKNFALLEESIALNLYYLNAQSKNQAKLNYSPQWRMINPKLDNHLKITYQDLTQFDQKFPMDFEFISRGNVDFRVASIGNRIPVLRMAIPLVIRKDGVFTQILITELDQKAINSVFAETTAYLSLLVSRRGTVLASTNPSQVSIGSSVSQFELFQISERSKNDSGHSVTIGESGEKQMGAFQNVGFANLTVLTQIPYSRALLVKNKVHRRTGFLTALFLFIALAMGIWLSRSLTRPIRALAIAADRVKKGDLKVRLKEIKGDEIQEFNGTFNEMVKGLYEGRMMRRMIHKFHHKEITDKLMEGKITLGGERLMSVVLFTDLRGFTQLSENADPALIVKILNRYMSVMVEIILKHGGIIDKLAGDSIMAVWGVPQTGPHDIENALFACLDMRRALVKLNRDFKKDGLPSLLMGMGLNYGELIAGNIGCEERMDYTVIGDTVNTAARIESVTKEFSVDLLVSQFLVDNARGVFLFEPIDEVKLKGKKEAIKLYKVMGYVNEKGEKIVETPYTSYALQKDEYTTQISQRIVLPFLTTPFPSLEKDKDIDPTQTKLEDPNEHTDTKTVSQVIKSKRRKKVA